MLVCPICTGRRVRHSAVEIDANVAAGTFEMPIPDQHRALQRWYNGNRGAAWCGGVALSNSFLPNSGLPPFCDVPVDRREGQLWVMG
jgi:hypothetical protein